MELKEQRKSLEINLETITNLWRSLWHRYKNKENRRTSKTNRKPKFLEWPRKCWKSTKRIKWFKRYSQ